MTEDIRITDFEQPVHTPAMLELLDSLKDTEIPLDKNSIKELAIEQLDVPFHHDPAMLQRFQDLFNEIQENGPLHKVGLSTLQQIAVGGLSDVARMEYLHARHADVGATPITKPVVIAGMPRSGTTHLLQLLATEPKFHTTMGWYSLQALPDKAMLEGQIKNTLRDNAALISQMQDIIMPHQLSMYTIETTEATEEIQLMMKAGYGVALSFCGNAPNFDNAFYHDEQADAYQFLYRFLQALQWVNRDNGASRWLLKSPQHLGALPALKNTFPDATMIFTHRDPVSVFTSLATMTGYYLRGFYSRCTKAQIIEKTLRMQHGLLRGLVNNIDNMGPNIEHIYFDQLMKNKIDAIARIYDLAGIEFDEKAQQRVLAQENSHGRGRAGRVIYDLEADFGLTRDELRKQFSYYTDRFPVAIEEVHQ